LWELHLVVIFFELPWLMILIALAGLVARFALLSLPGEEECTCCHRQMKIVAQHLGAVQRAGAELHFHSFRAGDFARLLVGYFARLRCHWKLQFGGACWVFGRFLMG
jgi:hypothetical protein